MTNGFTKPTPPTDIDDLLMRGRPREFESKGLVAMAQKAYSSVASHEVDVQVPHRVHCRSIGCKVIYNQIRSDIGEILRKLCEYKGIEHNRAAGT